MCPLYFDLNTNQFVADFGRYRFRKPSVDVEIPKSAAIGDYGPVDIRMIGQNGPIDVRNAKNYNPSRAAKISKLKKSVSNAVTGTTIRGKAVRGILGASALAGGAYLTERALQKRDKNRRYGGLGRYIK